MDGDLRDFPQWILQHTSYPKSLERRGIYGRVIVSFNVNTDGDVEDIKIERSVHKKLSKAVIRAVKRSPRWSPAEVRDAKVDFRIVLPITFSAKQNNI